MTRRYINVVGQNNIGWKTLAMVKVSLRLEPEFYAELKRISNATNRDISAVMRDLLKIGYIVMRPDATVRVRDLIYVIVPQVVDYIEQKEAKNKMHSQ